MQQRQMPPITKEHVSSFVDDGFLVVPDLLHADEIARVDAETVALARGRYPTRGRPAVCDAESTDDASVRSLLCVHQPHWISPVVRAMIEHPAICSILSRLVGAHLTHWDGAVKAMQSMLFFKGSGKPGQAWHQDELHIPTRDRSLCAAWIAIDDATAENGCLSVMPGSHRNGYLYPFRAHTDPEFDVSSESFGFSDHGETLVELKAGSVLFFNGYLLHRSRKNRSGRSRRALVNHYMNAWSLLPWDQEPNVRLGADCRIATADNRKVIPVAGVDPYAWKGYEVGGVEDVWLRAEANGF